MNTPHPNIGPTISPSDERDQRLAELLTQLSDRLRAGETIEVEAVCSAHPDLADELRQLWGAVLIADAVGSSSRSPELLAGSPVRESAGSAGRLELGAGDYDIAAPDLTLYEGGGA